jgi:hydrogenase maturation protease
MVTEELNATGTAVQGAAGTKQVLLIGLGNKHRHEDGVGLYIAHCLRAENLGPTLKIVEEEGDVLYLLDSWHDADVVIVVDAVYSGARPDGTRFSPGTVHHFEICRDTGCEEVLPQGIFLYSTHAFGLADIVHLAHALDRLPPRLIVYGVEGANFEMGDGISIDVLAGAEQVVSDIISYMEANS